VLHTTSTSLRAIKQKAFLAATLPNKLWFHFNQLSDRPFQGKNIHALALAGNIEWRYWNALRDEEVGRDLLTKIVQLRHED
jgi:hypothetical protein